MTITRKRMKELLKNDRFPRSAKYDPGWVLKGWMGPNVLWLTEWLCEKMELEPGMRVLDMGLRQGFKLDIFNERVRGAGLGQRPLGKRGGKLAAC
jgi:hypothetical protein